MAIEITTRKRKISSMITSLSKALCMNTATEVATTFVEQNDELDPAETAESSHLSPQAVATQEALLLATKTV